MARTTADDLIRLFETELDFIEGGGYGSPAGQPSKGKSVFSHTPVCINSWTVPGHKSGEHDECILLDLVPEEHKKKDLPCHFIPLNDAGDTVRSLEEKGDRDRLEAEVKSWLKTKITRLRDGGEALDVGEVKY